MLNKYLSKLLTKRLPVLLLIVITLSAIPFTTVNAAFTPASQIATAPVEKVVNPLWATMPTPSPIPLSVLVQKENVSQSPVDPKINSETIKAKRIDNKAQILADYLASYDSPLQYYAQDFIDAADKYDIDWKLVPAIAGVESTYGKFIPGGYNAWGWGVYGNQALGFISWRDGIYTVTEGLRSNYLNRGLTTPYAMNRVYAASPAWGGHVSFIMQSIENFAQSYKSDGNLAQQTQTAGESAQLLN